MLEAPWAGIPHEMINDGTLTLADMERYWVAAQISRQGTKSACCNCERIAQIAAHGVCKACHEAASGKLGADLLNALTSIRARYLQLDPPGAEDDPPPKVKVIGKIDLTPSHPPPRNKQLIHVENEAGDDMGTMAAYAARMLANENQPVPGTGLEKDVAMPTQSPAGIVPMVSRALIVEVGATEIEFRVRQGGLDIKVDDGTGCIWMAQGIAPDFLMDLYSMAKSAMEAR